MERYKEYKDSGVKWLGEIPSHWELLKSKFLWRETFENSKSGKEDLLSVSQYTGVTKSMADSRSESLEGYKIVHKDELVINIMLAWLGGLGVSDFEGVVSPAYCTYKLIRNENPKFLHYLYKTPMYLAEFARHSTGVVPSRWRMYTDNFGQVLSLLPPLPEQDAIVRYLDSATSELDKAIAMQQKMIDLLNERKQIIIQNAVTKGLDENVEMKESGVEWIGRIPKHWDVKPIKHLISLLTDYDANGSFADIAQNCNINNGAPYAWMVRTTDLVNRRYGIVNGNNYCDRKTYNYLSKSSLSVNDIIIAKRGDIGKVFLIPNVDVPMTLAPNTYLLKTLENKINNNYLYYALSSKYGKESMTIFNKSTTLGALYKDDVKALPIACPHLYEQQQIAAYLDSEMQKFDTAITNCQRQITLLQERKQIIINEVVTGKVRVS